MQDEDQVVTHRQPGFDPCEHIAKSVLQLFWCALSPILLLLAIPAIVSGLFAKRYGISGYIIGLVVGLILTPILLIPFIIFIVYIGVKHCLGGKKKAFA